MSKQKIYLILFIIIFQFTLSPVSAEAWNKLSSGIQYKKISGGSVVLIEDAIHLFRVDPSKFQIETVLAGKNLFDRDTAKSVCERNNLLLCLNANFFDPTGKALGLVVQNSVQKQKLVNIGNALTSVFGLSLNYIPFIIHRSQYISMEAPAAAVQVGPRLIADHTPTVGLHERHIPLKRSGVCIDDDQKVILFIVENTLQSFSFERLQEVLKPTCKDAMNFDGGGSSQLFVKDVSNDFNFIGKDLAPVFIGVQRK